LRGDKAVDEEATGVTDRSGVVGAKSTELWVTHSDYKTTHKFTLHP